MSQPRPLLIESQEIDFLRDGAAKSMPTASLRTCLFLAPALFLPFGAPVPARCQDSSAEGMSPCGDKAEIAVTIRDSSGEPVSVSTNDVSADDKNVQQLVIVIVQKMGPPGLRDTPHP